MCGYKIEFESRLIMLYPQHFIDDLKNRADIVRRIAILGLLLVFALDGFAQDKPKAVLVHEFGKVTCEEVSARADGFAQMLRGSVDAVGFAVVYPDSKFPERTRFYERQIVYSSYINGLDQSKLRVVRGASRNEPGVEFWKVPPGADEPQFVEDGWPNEFLESARPYIFDTSVDDGVCHTFIPVVYADVLKTHPDVRGHIVVLNSSRRDQKRTAREWIEKLVKDLKVPRNRLRVFYAKEGLMPYTELWIVPIKNR